MDDHRQAADIKQRLAPAGGSAAMRAGNQHQNAVFRARETGLPAGEKAAEIVGIGRKLARLYRVARGGANRYLNPAEGAAPKPDS
jgi:hypothetical protein